MIRYSILFLLAFLSLTGFGQDTLITNTGDVITGDIKGLKRNVIKIDPSYGENVFQIDWDDVDEVHSNENFVVLLSNGDRISGQIDTEPGTRNLLIRLEDGQTQVAEYKDVIEFYPFEIGFFNRLDGGIDASYTLSKASNSQSLNGTIYLDYLTDTWSFSAKGTSLVNYTNDSIISDRNSGDISLKLFIYRAWFAFANVSMLSTNEQNLDLRTSPTIGIGNYLVRSNRVLLSVLAGGVFTRERYTSPAEPSATSSGEVLIGTEMYTFDLGPLDFYAKVYAYPSLSIANRIRLDITCNVKLDIVGDLYMKVEYTQNYDSEPQSAGPVNDYMLLTGVGWEF